MNLDTINKIVIHLPERVDRLERTMDGISKFFENHEVTFIEGVRELPVFKGIAQAHLNAIRHAQEQGWPEVLIMEDDVNFQSKNSRSHADKCFSQIPDNWDLLLSSVYTSKGLTQYNGFWSQTKEFCGLTWYVVNQRAYDKILTFDKSMNIDRAMATAIGLNCFVVNEFFAIQYEGFSDNVNRKVNYDNLLGRFDVLK